MKTTIISVDQAIADGKYPWNKTENDVEYKGWVPGYSVGVCLEIKHAGNIIGYSDVTFINIEEDLEEIHPEDPLAVDPLSIKSQDIPRGEPTGRLVFRGYFEEEWDPEEHDYGYYYRSKEVLETLSHYIIGEGE